VDGNIGFRIFECRNGSVTELEDEKEEEEAEGKNELF
jgi:hypothetical protein